ncbi:GALT1 [Symbiodinium necroappetens]|nr:GALT1 [Symbiodinium necroappetens]
MEFKETFTLLMQVLFRYRYAEPVPRRAEVAACGLCDAEARQQRRAKAEDPDKAVAVVFCVMSRRSAHELRQVLRDTWGRSLVEKAPAVVQRFFVGTAANESHQLHDLDKGDVVELPVVESYRTLNLKALVMLSWAEKRYPNLQWLVRHDDDVYLRAPALLAQLASRPPVRYLWGMIDHGSSPVRDPEHQHYNSYEQFPKQDHPSWGDIFPPYARGLLWAMSADLVAAIVEAFNADVEERAGEVLGEAAANTVPHPDDPAVGVLIAGLVQGGMSINLDDRDFNSFSLNPSCNSTFSNIHNRTWVVHHVQPETMRCMWELDTAEAAQGIASQNSATDASNRIFPDLCLCSTEVVEEEDGEEEPFWYDRSRFNTAR